MRVVHAVLGAGGSTRMGALKLAMEFRGMPLIAHAARAGLRSGAERVVAVLGFEAEKLRGELPEGVEVVVNAEWATGLSSSIRAAVEASGEADALVIALADQPCVPAAHFVALSEAVGRGAGACATRYSGVVGVPACFSRAWFDELRAIRADRGAKELLSREGVRAFSCEAAGLDIDTPEDLARHGSKP